MAVSDGGDELLKVLAAEIFAELALGDLGEELAALDELHDEIDFGFGGEDFEELDDVGVTQAAHDGYLALDVGHQARADDLLLVDNFDGDAKAGLDVPGVVDLGEGAAAEEPAQFVLAEHGVFRRRCWRGRRIMFGPWHRERCRDRTRILYLDILFRVPPNCNGSVLTINMITATYYILIGQILILDFLLTEQEENACMRVLCTTVDRLWELVRDIWPEKGRRHGDHMGQRQSSTNKVLQMPTPTPNLLGATAYRNLCLQFKLTPMSVQQLQNPQTYKVKKRASKNISKLLYFVQSMPKDESMGDTIVNKIDSRVKVMSSYENRKENQG
ncbi:hypothetical protein RJ640_025208 [Escallonia rubra]|uniref:Uncharacterized protein n=1 Tax=Escallonia rubra TaxID=112253 RepID=A0AA88RZI1_9ASTE|nr:hypothetical protein RJ640_025208 [Escallonia rubra]